MILTFYLSRFRGAAPALALALAACGGGEAAPSPEAESVFGAPHAARGWEPPADGDWLPRWIAHLRAGSREGQRFALEQLHLAGAAAGPALAAELRGISQEPGQFGYAVNLLSALGASGAADQWPVLAEILRLHPTPVVRTSAAEAAARLRAPELLPALREALARESEAAPRRAALTAIARIGGAEAVAELEARVRQWMIEAGDGGGEAGSEAWNALMFVEGPEVLEALRRLDRELPPPLRVQALAARIEHGDRTVGPALRLFLDPAGYPSVKTRQLALTALAELEDWEAVLASASDPDPAFRASLARVLGTPQAVAAGVGTDLLDGWLGDADEDLATAALASLVAHGQRHRLDPWLLLAREFPLRSGSVEALLLLTREPLLDPRLPGVLLGCWENAEGVHRLDLMRALTKTGSEEGAAKIAEAMLDPREDPEVRRVAATLIANFPSCVGPLQRWYAERPGGERAADLVAGLGRHAADPDARAALLRLAADEEAPDAARKEVFDALPKLFGFEACALLQDLRARTGRADVRAYLTSLLGSWF